MAVLTYNITKDAFISSYNQTKNTGRDEILEIGLDRTKGVGYLKRSVITCDTQEISEKILNSIRGKKYAVRLKYFHAISNELPSNTLVRLHPLLEDFTNGTGKFDDVTSEEDGVNWVYSDIQKNKQWGEQGGLYNKLVSYTQSLSPNQLPDLNIDITDYFKSYISGSTPGYGLVLKLDDSLEQSTSGSYNIKYYSSDTNTIFHPRVELLYDDSVYHTGSLELIDTSNVVLSCTNNKGEYIPTGITRFRLSVKPTYPKRVLSNISLRSKNYRLPQDSSWSLVDFKTGNVLIDFDKDFTKVSVDEKGPYIDLDLSTLSSERYYKLEVKTNLDNSDIIMTTPSLIFKVVRDVR